EVDGGQRLLKVEGHLLIEALAVLGRHLAGLGAPNGLLLVGALLLLADINGEGDKIGVLFDDLAELPLVGKFGRFGTQFDVNLSPTVAFVGWLNAVILAPIGNPHGRWGIR